MQPWPCPEQVGFCIILILGAWLQHSLVTDLVTIHTWRHAKALPHSSSAICTAALCCWAMAAKRALLVCTCAAHTCTSDLSIDCIKQQCSSTLLSSQPEADKKTGRQMTCMQSEGGSTVSQKGTQLKVEVLHATVCYLTAYLNDTGLTLLNWCSATSTCVAHVNVLLHRRQAAPSGQGMGTTDPCRSIKFWVWQQHVTSMKSVPDPNTCAVAE